MDALVTETALTYGGPAPLLVAATSEAALRRARETASALGMRATCQVGIAAARQRLSQQAATSGIWIELDGDAGEELDLLLDEVEDRAAGRRFAAVVSLTSDLIDSVSSRMFDGGTDFLIDADQLERTTSLATATAFANTPERANDVSRDPGAERLRQLSDEVSRIAATLARLSTVPAAPDGELRKPVEGDVPDVSVETVRSVIRARRLRERFFAADLFADPAWDMLLDLLQAEIAQLRVPVSSLCIAAAVPATTALRWLKSMTDKGLFVRRADPHDGRRVFVELSREASVAMRRYFAEVGKAAVI
ncbi:MarR family winged helix-turn-helix transcriptional regulator [Sphingomonas sp. RG327]|uniref:MarR family winged helix-turn-helix transcriptional regulator n=1 Tax=Sphingomonas anseongensis TaxID=2908207 RepID=A0ABT0RDR7_9SPHN|nr:MarR family winged helix-turn-helix transcriptional regulator [Sphingomonas anseongensis]MCL6678392.1 MarR family winged helix-turn-helix transcriptional regulator [Sphingomonas anseongensis]